MNLRNRKEKCSFKGNDDFDFKVRVRLPEGKKRSPNTDQEYVIHPSRMYKKYQVGDHRLLRFSCSLPGCGMTFCKRGEIKEHRISHYIEAPKECCKKIYISANRLRLHILKEHREIMSCCFEGCGALLEKESDLLLHEELHFGNKPISLKNDCDKKFRKCQQCHIIFTDELNLVIHTQNNCFKCALPYCNVVARTELQRRNHITEHLGVFTYKAENVSNFSLIQSNKKKSLNREEECVFNTDNLKLCSSRTDQIQNLQQFKMNAKWFFAFIEQNFTNQEIEKVFEPYSTDM